ncbi:MAG: transglycosylase domain-containing protein [Bacteroidales bacterium]
MVKGIVIAMWSVFILGVISVVTTFILIYNGVVGYMPAVEELKNPTDKFATIIYSSDGKELGRFYQSMSNRVYVDYDEISDNVINALVATEDVRYESHSGVDMRAIMRSVVKRIILRQKHAGGGSTITQQLAKQLYSPSSETLFQRALQKPIEWAIAVKLEKFYTKDEIIKMYLNQFDFLNNAVGIKTAAHVYFGRTPEELTIEEAATLVGMVQNPSYFNPIRYRERTQGRRNIVLMQMKNADMITAAECDSLQAIPLKLTYSRVDHKEGLAPYFREELRRVLRAKKPVKSDYHGWEKQKYVDDSIAWHTDPQYGWVEKNRKPDGSRYNIYTDGLRIYTTIDSRMQQYAEEAVEEHLGGYLQPIFTQSKKGVRGAPYTTDREELTSAQLQTLIDRAVKQSERYRILKLAGLSADEIEADFNTPRDMRVFSYSGVIDTTMTPKDSLLYQKHFLRTGFMSMDPINGHVKAYVGGPNFSFFQYDMVSLGRRQIGSTIKPFLYTYAMEEGFTPCDMFLNAQPIMYDLNGNEWQPRNLGTDRIGEMVELRWALMTSNNWISARLMESLSPETLVRTMHNFGITNKLDAVISLCLGPCDVSVREMVSAYTAYANKGMRVAPLYVTKIANSNGDVISEFLPQHSEVISEKAYYKIISMLTDVVDYGTGNRVRRAPYNIKAPMGGKTGTTNSNSDGWFMGFTPELVSGVWVGGEERYIHFNGIAMGQGATMALPIYGLYMKKVYADETLPYSQETEFEFPENFDPCYDEFATGLDSYRGGVVDAEESVIEGMFD